MAPTLALAEEEEEDYRYQDARACEYPERDANRGPRGETFNPRLSGNDGR